MYRSILGGASRVAALTITAGATLALAACGGAGNSGGSGSAGGGGNLKEEDSPLVKWYEALYGEEEYDEEAIAAQQMETEKAAAACMQEQGFEYIPVDQSQYAMVIGSDDDGEPEWGTEGFAAQYGYMAFYDSSNFGSDEADDPNDALTEAMSESEQAAYFTALWGDQEAFSMEDSDFDYSTLTPEQKGCYMVAVESNSNELSSLWSSEEMSAFNEEEETLRESLEKDPGLKEADAEWATCMADAGYSDRDWTTPSDPEQWYQEESRKMWEELTADVDFENADENTEFPDPADTDEWKKRGEEEKDVAVADFGCRKSTGWDQAKLTIQFAAEEEFINSHKEQMDRIVEMYEEMSK